MTCWTRVCALLLVAAAGTGVRAASTAVSVSAQVLSNSRCQFNPGSPSLTFGSVDVTASGTLQAQTTVTFKCTGTAISASFSVSHDSGGYETTPGGSPQMRHADTTRYPTAFIPYAVSLTPSAGTVDKNVPQDIIVRGTIDRAAAADAPVGNYSDTLVITVVP